eukprot:6791143-Pyramimonas_sp.AAC.1
MGCFGRSARPCLLPAPSPVARDPFRNLPGSQSLLESEAAGCSQGSCCQRVVLNGRQSLLCLLPAPHPATRDCHRILP